MVKLKHIALAEAVIIIVLLGIIIRMTFYSPSENVQQDSSNPHGVRLLSNRIYSRILEPGSFLIMNFVPLRNNMIDFITKNKLDISVYVRNLKSGGGFVINEQKKFFPASLTKVLVAILVMKKIEKGDLSLDTLIDINESDRVDTAGTLYMSPEKRLPVRTLLKYMLSDSDNTALRTLQRYTDQEDKFLIMNYLNFYIDRNMDKKDLEEDTEHNVVTPRSIYNLFSSLYLSTILQPAHSEFLLSLLIDTDFDIKTVAELPDTVTVAHKFGANYTNNKKNFHDCGIMYIHPKDVKLFYCIMSQDMYKETASKTIGLLVQAIYSYTLDVRNKFDYYKTNLYESKILEKKDGKREAYN